jgi:hypothetical protein
MPTRKRVTTPEEIDAVAETIVMDIGNGFVMDDYRMVKRVG